MCEGMIKDNINASTGATFWTSKLLIIFFLQQLTFLTPNVSVKGFLTSLIPLILLILIKELEKNYYKKHKRIKKIMNNIILYITKLLF